jgi:hypothetical protein
MRGERLNFLLVAVFCGIDLLGYGLGFQPMNAVTVGLSACILGLLALISAVDGPV